ncbi:MAG: hypothetical protein EB027_05755, partial [Actinobacteria bacterium]|nr:hypothetical protein [Actinomycetota bacterium]
MTQGRLYKSARATGPMADDAILALPAKPGGSDSLHTDAGAVMTAGATPEPSAGTETSTGAEPSTQAPHSTSTPTEPARIAVTDFDHIFADEVVAVTDDDDLFPWEHSPGSSRGEVPAPGVP